MPVISGVVSVSKYFIIELWWNCYSGSHWKRVDLFNEVITGSVIRNSVFSGFSFSLLRDRGWYGIDDINLKDFFAGKGMRCDWLNAFHAP